MKSPQIRYRALFLLYRLFQTTKIFYLPDDEIATAAAQFGEETRAGGGVEFNVNWRRCATKTTKRSPICTGTDYNVYSYNYWLKSF